MITPSVSPSGPVQTSRRAGMQTRVEAALAQPSVQQALELVAIEPTGNGIAVEVRERTPLAAPYREALLNYLKTAAAASAGESVEVSVSEPSALAALSEKILEVYDPVMLYAVFAALILYSTARWLFRRRSKVKVWRTSIRALQDAVAHDRAKNKDRAQVRRTNREMEGQVQIQAAATIEALRAEQSRLNKELEGLLHLWSQSRVEIERLRVENASLRPPEKLALPAPKPAAMVFEVTPPAAEAATATEESKFTPNPPPEDLFDLEFL